jgi:hypothetical protein
MRPRTQHCVVHHGDAPTRDRSGHCSACRRERKRRERHERRELLRRIKLERGCGRCGHCDDPAQLHFHHRDPATKTAKVAYMIRWGIPRLLAEVAKCEVLCVGCHTAHHHRS